MLVPKERTKERKKEKLEPQDDKRNKQSKV